MNHVTVLVIARSDCQASLVDLHSDATHDVSTMMQASQFY